MEMTDWHQYLKRMNLKNINGFFGVNFKINLENYSSTISEVKHKIRQEI